MREAVVIDGFFDGSQPAAAYLWNAILLWSDQSDNEHRAKGNAVQLTR
jgi:hypothetical protein